MCKTGQEAKNQKARRRWDWIPGLLVSSTERPRSAWYPKTPLGGYQFLFAALKPLWLNWDGFKHLGSDTWQLSLKSKMGRRLRRHLSGKKTKADIKNYQFPLQLAWLNSLALNLHPCTCNSNAWWRALICFHLLVLSDWKWCFANNLFTVAPQP